MTIEKTINQLNEIMQSQAIKKNDKQYYGLAYDGIYNAYKSPSYNKVKAFRKCEQYVQELCKMIESKTGCPCECYLKGIGSANCQIFTYVWRYRITCENGDITLFIKDTAYHMYYSYQ